MRVSAYKRKELDGIEKLALSYVRKGMSTYEVSAMLQEQHNIKRSHAWVWKSLQKSKAKLQAQNIFG